MIEDMLQGEEIPFELQWAQGLSSGLEKAAAGDFDLVLLDLGLPDSQGEETFARIYEHAPAVPIIILTGLDDEALATTCVQQGAQDYLVKGAFDGPLLVRAIRYAIDRHRFQEALKQGQSWLSTTLQSIGDAVIATDAAGYVRLMNTVAQELTGWSQEEAAGRPLHKVFRIVNEKTDEPVESPVDKVLREGLTVGLANHTLLVARDGTRIPIDDSGAPIRGEQGETTGVVLVFRDASERRRAEKAYRLLAAMVEQSTDSIIRTDTAFRITYINRAAEEMFGWTLDEVKGKRPDIFNATPLPTEMQQQIYATVSSGRTYLGEGLNVRKDGSTFICDMKISPIWDEDGQICGYMGSQRDVTQQKETEKALRKSEREKAVILSSVSELVSYQDRDLRIIWANRAAAESVDSPIDELVGRHCYEVWPQQSEPCTGCPVVRAIETGTPQSAEMTTPDERVWFIRGYPVRGPSGEITGAVEVTLEITERVRAEEEVRYQAGTLAALHETALELATYQAQPDLLEAIVARAVELLEAKGGGIYLYRPASDDLEYAFTYKTVPDTIGTVLKRGEGLSGKVLERGHSLAVDNYSQWEGRSPQFEAYGLTASVAVPIRWGEHILGVLAVDADVPRTFTPQDVALLERFTPLAAAALENTRLFAAERERRQIAETLQQAATILSSTLELKEVLDLILEQLQQVIPYDSASVQQLHDEALRIVAGHGFEQRQKITGLTFTLDPKFPNHRVIETQAPVAIGDVRQHYPVFQDEAHQYGSGHIRSWLGIPLLIKDRILGMIALDRTTLHPFTAEEAQLAQAFAHQAAIAIENARLYSDLQEQMDELTSTQAQLVQSAKLAAVGELAAGVAHELNNPLTSILGFAEILQEDLEEDEVYDHNLQTIVDEARRARRIVRGLLDFARQQSPERRPADVNCILQQTLGVIRYHLEKSRIIIQEEYAPDLALVSLDEGQIKQVFLNLISNAAQAMPQGGTLSLKTAQTGPEVAVSFTDSGVGIPVEDQGRIFDPFYSTKKSGTGLGLSVSLGIVQSHGGRITVESQQGQGSTFTVWLPIP